MNAPEESNKVVDVAVAVVEFGDRVLIGQRPPGADLAGLWEFPGGKMEPGESTEFAATRECQEETGIHAVSLQRMAEHTEAYAHATVRLHFVRCHPKPDSSLKPLEPYRWVPRSDLDQYEFPRGNRVVLEQLVQSSRARKCDDC